MDVGALFNQVRNNSKFYSLSYSDQQQVWASILSKRLSNDPQFLGLSPNAQRYVFDKYLIQPPAMENKQFERRISNIGEGVKQTDKNAIAEATTLGYWGRALQNSVILSTAKKLYQGLVDIGLTVANKIDPDLPWKTFGDIHQIPDKGKDLFAGTEYLNQMLDKEQGAIEKAAATQALTRTPAEQYYHRHEYNPLTFQRRTLPIAGTIFDTAVLYAAGVGTLAKPRGLAKLGMQHVDKLIATMPKSSAALWGFKVARAGVHSVAGGVMGIARENLKDIYEGNLSNAKFQKVLGNSAKYFGEYFLGDAAVFAAGGLLKNTVGALGKNFIGWTKGVAKPGYVSLDEYKKLITSAISLEDVPVELWNKLGEPEKEILSSLRATATTANRVEKLTPEDLLKAIGMSKGYIVQQKPTGWLAKHVTGKGPQIADASFDNIQKWLFEQLNDLKVAPVRKLEAGAVGTATRRIQVNKILEGTLPSGFEKVDDLARIIAPTRGRFKSEHVKLFSKALLKGSGATDDIVRAVRVNELADGIEVFVKDAKIATLPMNVTSGSVEIKAIRELTEGLSSQITDVIDRSDLIEGMVKLYPKTLEKAGIYSPAWVEYAARESLGTMVVREGGKINFQGMDLQFDSFEDAANWLIRDSLNIENYGKFLGEHGYRLQKSKVDGKLTVRRGKGIIASGQSVHELVDKLPEYLAPKVSSSLGPKGTIVNPLENRVRYVQNGIAFGDAESVLEHLSKFRNQRINNGKVKIKGERGSEIILNKASQQFEVYVPELEYRQNFNSLTEAKNFIQRGFEDFSDVNYVALRKGFRVEPFKGKWAMYSEGRQFLLNNLDEVRAKLRSVKAPEWAPELTDFDELLSNSMQKIPEFQYKPETLGFPNRKMDYIPANWYLRNIIQPPTAQLEKAIKIIGSSDLMDLFNRAENARDFIRAMDTTLVKLLDNAFALPSGRSMKLKDRLQVSRLLEIPESKWNSLKGIAAPHVESARKVRDLLGKSDETGLFKYFNVKPERFLENYLPRLKQFAVPENLRNYSDVDIGTFLKDAFSGQVPGELQAWFKNARVSDIVDFVRELDPLILLRKYITTGHRSMMLNPILDDVRSFLSSKAGKAIDSRVTARFGLYLDQVAGIPQGNVKKDLQRFTQLVFDKLMPGKRPLAKNFTELILGLGYLSSMAFRPWVPIRNTFQIWTTLASRMSNTWTAEGLDAVMKDSGGEIFERMVKGGMLQSHVPVYGGEFLTGQDAVAKIFRKGMSWFRNSDDFTRAVVFKTCDLRFNDALKRLQAGRLNTKQFVEMSGLWNLETSLRNKVLNYISKGQASTGLDVFANEMTRETIFPYRAGMGPTAFTGTLGELFGQMGHYPVYYVDNIRKGLTRGSAAQRIAFAGRFVGNGLALYGAFKAIGVQANNFLPWIPAAFSGGPYYSIVNQLLASFNPSYKGRQARAELFGFTIRDGKPHFNAGTFAKSEIAQWIVPGSLALKYLVRGWKYANEGDWQRAMISFSSAPIVPKD